MASILYKNEQAKRAFYKYLQFTKGFSPKSIACYENAIWLWEDFAGRADFANFNQSKAIEFVGWLKNRVKKSSKERVGLTFCYNYLRYLKVFFNWLARQKGYRSKIDGTAVDYLNLTKGEVRIATQPGRRQSATLEEVKTVLEGIKGDTEIEMRDKALISLTYLTGARISALITLPIASFDREKLILDQNPKLGVKTKISKRIPSALITLFYKEPLQYFLDWFDYLAREKKFQPTDPIFPATKRENGKEALGFYSNDKVEPVFWKSTSSLRKIFQKRFKEAGVPYYHPHTFRHLLVKEISKLPLTEEQKKAISQNLGHENVGTTFGSYGYGHIEEERQMGIIRGIGIPTEGGTELEQLLKKALETLKKKT